MSREYPCPDLESASVPKVDRYIRKFVGSHFPKKYNEEMSLIQIVMLKSNTPLTSLLDEGVMEHPKLQVSAPVVLQLIQQTVCYCF